MKDSEVLFPEQLEAPLPLDACAHYTSGGEAESVCASVLNPEDSSSDGCSSPAIRNILPIRPSSLPTVEALLLALAKNGMVAFILRLRSVNA
ncbi:hypothetical protein B0H13DRAFT_2348746 [Mycena leptocephala]|nr:hypothetical protein B0H13DRAFT_2348746 [Mycena leptocephala]